MSHEDDLFAALAGATFVELVSDEERDRRARQVRRRIRWAARRERVAAIRRWWLALFAGVVLVIAGVGAAGAGLLHRQPDWQQLVWCYTRVPENINDDTARFALTYIGEGPTSAQQALDLCYSNPDGTMQPIPDQVSQCIVSDGYLAVIPVGKCADIGLPESEVQSQPGDD